MPATSIRKRLRVPGLAERCLIARREMRLTQEKAAALLNVSVQAVANWESGRHGPSEDSLRRMVEVYGKPINWFLGAGEGRSGIDVIREVPTRGYVSAGTPRETYEVELDPTPIPVDVAASFPGAFVLIVSGDSLMGDGISDGDRLLINPHAVYQAGRLFVVRLPDGELAARHLFVEDGHVRLRAANDEYEDLTATGVQMLGQVVWHLRRMW